MKAHDGYRSRNTWNCVLWLTNDYATYQRLVESAEYAKKRYPVNLRPGGADDPNVAERRIAMGAKHFNDRFHLLGSRTKDGARYTMIAIKAAIAQVLD